MTVINIGKEANKAFYPLFRNESRILLLRGGAGSGKSYFAAQKIIYRCFKDGIKHRFLVLRKTQNAVYKSCQLVIQKWLDEWGIPYTATYLKIIFDGHTIMFSGLDDPMKIKSIEGITGIWMEEATEFNYKDFSQLNLRIRGEIGAYKQIILTFNPEGGKTSWIYKEFFDVEDNYRDFTSHHSTWRNNAFIDDEYKIELINEKNDTLKKIYDLGEWAELANAIYHDYSKVSVNVASVLRVADKIYGGIDFGFNDPSVFLLIAEHDSDIYILKELYKRGLTNAEFIVEVKKLLESIKVEVDSKNEDVIDLMNIEMYADSAEPARIKEFSQAGLRCQAANKKVVDGIDEVRRHHLVINSECLNACKEIPQYCYQEDKDGNILEEPNKSHDHTCLVGDTIVIMDNGFKYIKDVKIGDKVLTPIGYKEVINSGQTGIETVMHFTQNNKTLVGTKDHPIYQNNKKIPLKDASIDVSTEVKDIWKSNTRIQKKVQLLSGMIKDIIGRTKDITLEQVGVKKRDTCIEIYGNTIEGLYPMGITFITKMKILTTIILATSNALLQKNTLINIVIVTLAGVKRLTMRLISGIGLKKVERSTENKQENIGQNILPQNVLSVGKSLIKKTVKPQKRLALDPVLEHTEIETEKQPVYNITVKDAHNYYADGFLVSNCDAVRYGVYTSKKTGIIFYG